MKIRLSNLYVYFAVAVLAIAAHAGAASVLDITFPIAELGNCEDKNACRTYCDQFQNIEVCASFGEKYSLTTASRAGEVRRFARALQNGGPGKCSTPDQCLAYCDEPNHIDECILFAERNQLQDADEIIKLKRVIQTLREGSDLPGNCRNASQCRAYCADPDHARDCLAFAERHGILDREIIEQTRKVLPLIDNKETPGGCQSRAECGAYCSQSRNIDECAQFGLRIGVLTDVQAEIYRKTRGRGPGGCQGEACRAYCNNPSNKDACIAFALEHQLLSEEKIKEFHPATSEKPFLGPAGCTDTDSCRRYCNDPAHARECAPFLIPQATATPKITARPSVTVAPEVEMETELPGPDLFNSNGLYTSLPEPRPVRESRITPLMQLVGFMARIFLGL